MGWTERLSRDVGSSRENSAGSPEAAMPKQRDSFTNVSLGLPEPQPARLQSRIRWPSCGFLGSCSAADHVTHPPRARLSGSCRRYRPHAPVEEKAGSGAGYTTLPVMHSGTCRLEEGVADVTGRGVVAVEWSFVAGIVLRGCSWVVWAPFYFSLVTGGEEICNSMNSGHGVSSYCLV